MASTANASDSPADTHVAARLITPAPGVLLAIGTFAAVPYVHLHLESRRRFYPGVPCVVHDDASPFGAQLQELCVSYGAHFHAPPARLKPQTGDLSAILLAIRSARQQGCELAVKMSRRFVPLLDWVPPLQRAALETQSATLSNRDDGHGHGFSTECVAFHAPSWGDPWAVGRIERAIDGGAETFGFVEAFVHTLAREVHARTQCEVNRERERLSPPAPDADAYGPWPWLGTSRAERRPEFLWHDSDTPLDYYRLSLAYGLQYRYEDFVDPNMGCGAEPPPAGRG